MKNIQKTKEKIIEVLENKSKAEFLADDYIEAEKKLLKELETLKNFGSECDCEEDNIINVVFEGDEPEISSYCLKCGGYVNE